MTTIHNSDYHEDTLFDFEDGTVLGLGVAGFFCIYLARSMLAMLPCLLNLISIAWRTKKADTENISYGLVLPFVLAVGGGAMVSAANARVQQHNDIWGHETNSDTVSWMSGIALGILVWFIGYHSMPRKTMNWHMLAMTYVMYLASIILFALVTIAGKNDTHVIFGIVFVTLGAIFPLLSVIAHISPNMCKGPYTRVGKSDAATCLLSTPVFLALLEVSTFTLAAAALVSPVSNVTDF